MLISGFGRWGSLPNLFFNAVVCARSVVLPNWCALRIVCEQCFESSEMHASSLTCGDHVTGFITRICEVMLSDGEGARHLGGVVVIAVALTYVHMSES